VYLSSGASAFLQEKASKPQLPPLLPAKESASLFITSPTVILVQPGKKSKGSLSMVFQLRIGTGYAIIFIHKN
jgi:hypothetical protein